MASQMGFSITFMLAGLLCIVGCLVLLVLERRSARKAEDLGGEACFRRIGMGSFLSRLADLGQKSSSYC